MRRIMAVCIALLQGVCPCLAQQAQQTDNLLANGDLETDEDGDGVPDGWSWHEGGFGTLGKVFWSTDDPLQGEVCIRYVKTDPQKWYPQVWHAPVEITPGWQYELSALVQSDAPFVFRHTLSGDLGGERHQRFSAQAEPTRVSLRFDSPPGSDRVSVGFQMSDNAGTMLIDDVRLVALGPSLGTMLSIREASDIHDLEELAARRRFKPFDLIADEEGVHPSERVIFRDTATGAITARMTHSPYYNRHIYSNQWIWNCDGSLLAFRSRRDPDGWYIMDADGNHIRYLIGEIPFWSRSDPDIVFHRDTSDRTIRALNVRTGEQRIVFTIPDELDGLGFTIWPMHPDGKKLFVVVGNQTARRPDNWGYLVDIDSGEYTRIDFPHTTHQVWFTKDPDYTISYNYERRAPGEYIDVSMLVDADGTNHRQARARHMSHRGYSPDGTRVAFHAGGGIHIMDALGGNERLLATGGGGHLSWQVDDEWLVATMRNAIYRIWTDDGHKTLINLPNTQLHYYNYPCEAHLESSPDGTKIGYASSMLGDIDLYQVVMKPPDPPRNLSAHADGERISLTWEPPEHSREVMGYNVWASDVSGEGYHPVTWEPVRAAEYSCGPAEGLCFVVTAVEHSGLEGRPSKEACIAGPDLPRRIWLEAEDAELRAPFEPIFSMECSAMYCVASTAHGKAALATLSAEVPAGSYLVWARTRGMNEDAALQLSAGGEVLGAISAATEGWSWQLAAAHGEPASLSVAEGEIELELTAQMGGIMVDQLLLSSDAEYRPEGAPTWLRRAAVELPAVTGLEAEAISPYCVRLSWDEAAAPDLSHYNVYACSDGEPAGQEHLIASPAQPRRFDWGLQAGTEYRYAVTVVDRQGNEGPPVTASATTPEIDRVFEEIEANAQLKEGPLSFDVTLPRDDSYVTWVRIASRDERRGTLDVWLDGEKIMSGGYVPWEFVTRGHGGPQANVPLWVPVQVRGEMPRSLREIAAGEHTMRIAAGDAIDAVIDRAVITNDLGWRPAGISSFLGAEEGTAGE